MTRGSGGAPCVERRKIAKPIDRLLEKVALSVQEQVVKQSGFGAKKVIVLAGPTGAGKTAISLKLAAAIGGEIISADSMQVYRGMDIGTAKATTEEREKICHHLIDIRDIKDPFNVKDFYNEAMTACRDILNRGRTPIVVGGTGFYIHSLLYGPPAGPEADPQVRAALEEEEKRFGIELLFEKLTVLDPEYAKTISQNDRHKILRALEIIELSGRRVSSFEWKSRKPSTFFDWRCWFLHWPRKMLYERLERRCVEMLKFGLLEEVVKLDRAGIRKNRTAAQAIGYRQTLDFLDSAQRIEDYEKYVENLKMASRHLAKRQFTWFRKESGFHWLDLSQHTQEEIIDTILKDFQQERTVEL